MVNNWYSLILYPVSKHGKLVSQHFQNILSFLIPASCLNRKDVGRAHISAAFRNFESTPETKIDEFANNVGLDEVAQNEAPHQDLHCLPSSL